MGPTRVTAAVPTPSHPLQTLRYAISGIRKMGATRVSTASLKKDVTPHRTLLLLAVAALCIGCGCSRKNKNKDEHHSVTLTWIAPEGPPPVSYNIYRSTGQGYFLLAHNVVGPPYEDRIVKSGQVYFYVVTAVDKAGHESRFSVETSATVP
jgi:hypothetical protein